MTYKTAHLSDKITLFDAVTQKRWDMIRRLSREFTTEHKTALAMDELLSEQIEIEGMPQPAPVPPVKPKPAPSASPKVPAPKPTKLSLFDEMNDKKGGSQQLPPVFSGKVGFNNLDDDLQKRLSESVQVIQYRLPDAPAGPKVAKSNIPDFQKVVDDVVLGQNVFLVGGAGTGKTTLAQKVAAALGREYMTINCSQWTAPTEIIGGQTLDGYQEGKLIEAWKLGYILILDELPKIDPNTAGLFNDALAKSKIPNAVIFNSRKEHFTKHPNFAVIATGNVWPIAESMAYGANNKQDLSLLDRFAGCVYSIEKNPQLEQSVVGSLTLWGWCAELRRVVEDLRYEAQISMRFMMTCRDTLILELQRTGGKGGLNPDEGKTLCDCFESFIASNFTPVQQKTIKDNFNAASSSKDSYSLISGKEYREKYGKTLTAEFVKAGYINPKDGGLSGLGSTVRRYIKGEE